MLATFPTLNHATTTARIRAEEEPAIPRPERIALVPHHAGRRTGAGIVARGQHAGVGLVPVRGERVLARPPILGPSGSMLDNYQEAWTRAGMGRLLFNSAVVAVVSSVGKIVISMLSAFAIVYFNFRGKAFWQAFVLIGQLLPTAAIIVPLCLAFGWFDRFTPSTALLLAISLFMLVQLPFSIFWLRHFQFGPVEWVWRRMTYGRAVPLKMAASDYAPI